MTTPAGRAAKMIVENRYLTLATASSKGPWAAPINYANGPGRYLHFYSARRARHSQDIGESSIVAAAVFNSQATQEDMDGIQLEASCSILHSSELAVIHEYYFNFNLTPDVRDWWMRPVSAFDEGGISAFYRLDIRRLWVMNFESVERERVDSRLEVDLAEMWDQAENTMGGAATEP